MLSSDNSNDEPPYRRLECNVGVIRLRFWKPVQKTICGLSRSDYRDMSHLWGSYVATHLSPAPLWEGRRAGDHARRSGWCPARLHVNAADRSSLAEGVHLPGSGPCPVWCPADYGERPGVHR